MTTTLPDDTSSRPRWVRRTARVTTEVLAPSVVVVLLPLLIAAHAAASWPLVLAWGLLVATFGSAIPMAVIIRGARRGHWDGHHVGNREGRWVPLLVCITSVATALALLLTLGAPRAMVALDVAMLATLLAILPITGWWKISVHTGVAGGAVVILACTYGPHLLAAAPLVALIGWSRVELGDHTTAQTTVGTILGALVAGITYAGLL